MYAVDDVASYFLVKWIKEPPNLLDADSVMSPISDTTKFLRVHPNVHDHVLPLHPHKLLPLNHGLIIRNLLLILLNCVEEMEDRQGENEEDDTSIIMRRWKRLSITLNLGSCALAQTNTSFPVLHSC